jgi:hypothetical protein
MKMTGLNETRREVDQVPTTVSARQFSTQNPLPFVGDDTNELSQFAIRRDRTFLAKQAMCDLSQVQDAAIEV